MLEKVSDAEWWVRSNLDDEVIGKITKENDRFHAWMGRIDLGTFSSVQSAYDAITVREA